MTSVAKILTRNKQIEAALNNEQVTRKRVETLESVIRSQQDRIKALESVIARARQRNLWGRLGWLVRGQ